MKVKLEEFGSLQVIADQEADWFAEANHRELGALGEDVKRDVRADIKKAKIKGAARLGNAWRGKLFPRSPKAHALKPAYVLGNNAPEILETFEKGGTIRAKGGALMIPIGAAKRVKLPPGTAKEKLPEIVLRMYGAHRFVSQRLKKTRELALGLFSAAEGPRKFIPLFLLRKEVEAPELFHAEEIIEEASHKLPDRHARGVHERFDRQLTQAGRTAPVIERVTTAG